MEDVMNDTYIPIIKLIMTSVERRNLAMDATQSLVSLLGKDDLAAKALMEAHNALGDGHLMSALANYRRALELLEG
jgi:hypothetical protein